MVMLGAIFGLMIGGGLMLLGAFFLGRVVSRMAGWWRLLPLWGTGLSLIVCCVMTGAAEVSVGVIWGMVIFNCGWMGILLLRGQVRVDRVLLSQCCGWLAFGISVCWWCGMHGGIGRLSGLGLCLVGMVAMWRMHPRQAKLLSCRWCIGGTSFLMLIIIGSWLVVQCYPMVATWLKMPESVCGSIVLAPLAELAGICGLRQQEKGNRENLFVDLMKVNTLLVTLGLGSGALWAGRLSITQSTRWVTLPMVGVMSVLFAVLCWLPQKNTRWLGGLVVMMLLGWAVTLLG